MNVEEGEHFGDTLSAFIMNPAEGSTGVMGLWATNQYDVYSWVLMTLQNIPPGNGNDRLEIYQLDARRDWFDLDVVRGVLEPQEQQDFVLTLSTIGLPDTTFNGILRFTHNAEGGMTDINVELRVIPPIPPEAFDLVEPVNGDTITAEPRHGDTLTLGAIIFKWNRAVEHNVNDTSLFYRVYLQAAMQTAMVETRETTLVLDIDTLGLPIWFDMPVTWWVTAYSAPDSVRCRRDFFFNILANPVDRDDEFAPIEFGLHSVYPSPFNSRTTIKFGIDRAVKTTLKVYDLTGRECATLFDQTPEPANYKVTFDASSFASSVYFLHLESAGRRQIRKVVLMR